MAKKKETAEGATKKKTAKKKTAKAKPAVNKQANKQAKPARKKAAEQGAARATVRDVRIAPRKARLVLDLVKGQQVEQALQVLRFSPKKGARILSTLLTSAVANARENGGLDVDRLWITAGWVDMGKSLRRYMPRAQGRATEIRKRSSHITVVLGER